MRGSSRSARLPGAAAEGDQALRAVGGERGDAEEMVVDDHVLDGPFGRVGGEEFGLLLPETEPEEAREAAERIRRLVEQTVVETAAGPVRATISLGIAPMPAVAEGSATWLSEADIALYEAKNFGRNRVILAKPRRPATPAGEMEHGAAAQAAATAGNDRNRSGIGHWTLLCGDRYGHDACSP